MGKGGNCVPFRGMHDIPFRLEFETSQNKQGTQSDCSKPDDQCSFAQVSCDNSDALENTLYSFRQFTYVWDHPMYTANTVNIKTSPVQSDSLNAWPAVFAPANVGTAASGKNKYVTLIGDCRSQATLLERTPKERSTKTLMHC